ncbi:hypothetical protein H5410_061250 [Solanum commersonii]|uniref:Uncharacterized protein n=1 Tax=Solanum commersonii TaxID=4109 RepID=A0A9J5W8C7_SOLCO|nr:hypothetical protein H5410_061250 [Solanum commersonii]
MNDYYLPIQGFQEKAPYYARPSYYGKHTLMQVQATQGRVLLLNPSYHEMMCPHQVKLSCKHSIILLKLHWKANMHGFVLPSQANH